MPDILKTLPPIKPGRAAADAVALARGFLRDPATPRDPSAACGGDLRRLVRAHLESRYTGVTVAHVREVAALVASLQAQEKQP